MRVLVVEDDELFAEALRKRVAGRIPNAVVNVAFSLSEAETAIETATIDAAVIDLRIPSSTGAPGAENEFGLAVEALLARRQPGALRVFLTAAGPGEVVKSLQYGATGDFFFLGEVFPIVEYVQKSGVDSLDECVELVAAHAERLKQLDELELHNAGTEFDVDARRALSITVLCAGGTKGNVLKTEGHSQCKTALVECFGADGLSVGNAFCKAGPPKEIEREQEGYKRAEFQLPQSARPTLARSLQVGVGAHRALIYTEAPTRISFFDLLSTEPARCAEVIGQLPAIVSRWTDGAAAEVHDVAAIVESVTSPQVARTFAEELSVRVDVDGLRIEALSYCQHGDLHGANLFVTDDGAPFLIDFAHTRVQEGPVDPVSLELSTLFHPASPTQVDPNQLDLSAWFDTDYVESLESIAPTVLACRHWSSQVGHTAEAHALATLLYSVWILNHASHPSMALDLAQAASQRLHDGLT